jgi:hypothetical protein
MRDPLFYANLVQNLLGQLITPVRIRTSDTVHLMTKYHGSDSLEQEEAK